MSKSIQDLTMVEIEKLEELSGLSITQLQAPNIPQARLMTALASLLGGIPFEEAQGLTLSEISAILGDDDASPEAPSA